MRSLSLFVVCLLFAISITPSATADDGDSDCEYDGGTPDAPIDIYDQLIAILSTVPAPTHAWEFGTVNYQWPVTNIPFKHCPPDHILYFFSDSWDGSTTDVLVFYLP